MPSHLSRPITITLVAAFISIALSAAPAPKALGRVHFQTSCNAQVQSRFDEAVALLHSFEFAEAEQLFGQVERLDPNCVIAAWGMALAVTERRGANAPAAVLAKGWKQLQPWLSKKAQTDREQLYVEAVRGLYEGHAQSTGEERWGRYLERLAAIRQRYSKDTNASLFYALGLVWTAGPGSNGIAQRRKALAILLPLFEAEPDGPGAAHYIIHAADTPELAASALPAARKYATIAPDSPHALHMPSHIFSRLGYWQEMVNSNQDSARVAASWVKEGRDGRFDELHALTYLEYAYLQLDDREQARMQIARMHDLMAVPGGDPWAEIDGRILYDLQTREWRDAIQIKPPAVSPAQDNFDVYWVHAIAWAQLGDLKAARESLHDLSESIAHQRSGTDYANALHLYHLQAEAAVEAAAGESDKAVATLKSAATFEQAHPVDYPNVLAAPSAECLGTLFLQLGRPVDALKAFQQALVMAPKTLHSVRGVKQIAASSVTRF